MKTIRTILLFALALFLLVIACDNILDPEQGQELGSANQDDYGTPHHIYIASVPDDQTSVKFGLITDTHIDASYAGKVAKSSYPYYDYRYRDTDHVKRNRTTITGLNVAAYHAGCHGIIHLGDMVNDNNTQNLVAFRQLYENDYPGYDAGAIAGVGDDHHQAYSQGYRINKPVFPTLGNHDSPYYNDSPTDWQKAASYIRDRIKDASGLI